MIRFRRLAMGIGLLLKKEGISNVRKLDTMNINKIASFISEKICQSFPELHLSQSELFIQISRLDMFIASMDDNASAKYVYGKNAIYFNEKLDLNKMDIAAIHECIHYLQEFKDEKGNLAKLGLYDLNSATGLALNEAAVQLIACRTARGPMFDNVTYYGMSFVSESPEFYPLECALVSQMTFFTGDEALYFSTLYSSPMFERAFTSNSTPDTFYEVEMDLDKLLHLENELSKLSHKLQISEASGEKSKLLQRQIEGKKKNITSICLKIQNMIIANCFKKRFVKIDTFDDIREFEKELVEFRKYLILPDNYSFYDDFCKKMMEDISFKKNQIVKYGRVVDIPKEYGEFLPMEISVKKMSKVREIICTLKEFIFGE